MSMIRSGGGGSGGTFLHPALLSRELPDQHPIPAITGLVDALADLAKRIEDLDIGDIDISTFLRPFKPVGLAPANGELNLALYVRLKITPYGHPLGIPIGGVHWQVSEVRDFSSIIFDRRIISVVDSIVITETPVTNDNQNSEPYLEPDKQYFWRARYYDLRDSNSEWSDPLSFSTDIASVTNSIVTPDIFYPYNGGWVPEKGLIVQLTQPIVIGNAVPDVSDLQVSITPDFAGVDIILDKQDVDDTVIIKDTNLNLIDTPAPIYMRARHKDSVAGIDSKWSAVPEIWIQRAFRDLVVGMVTYIKGYSSYTTWIDKKGNHVSPHPSYWNDHPIWGGLAPANYLAYNGMTLAGNRFPAFYCNADTEERGNETIHRIWVSPVPVDNFYLHPAFALSPNGFMLSNYFASAKSTTQNTSETLYTMTAPSEFINFINALNEPGNTLVRHFNIHARNALLLLFCIENADHRIVENTAIFHNAQIQMLSNYHYFCEGIYISSYSNNSKIANIKIGRPNNLGSLIDFGDVFCLNANTSDKFVKRIKTGYNNDIGAHLDLYHIPDEYSDNQLDFTRYYAGYKNSTAVNNNHTGITRAVKNSSIGLDYYNSPLSSNYYAVRVIIFN